MTRHSGGKFLKMGLAAATALLAISAPARPHTHIEPDGETISWYPKDCCHEGDCRPIARISLAPQGLWMTTTDGFTVFIGPQDKRRPSLDLRWHVCMTIDEVDNITPKINCIFEPPAARAPNAIDEARPAHRLGTKNGRAVGRAGTRARNAKLWHQGASLDRI